MKRVSMLLSAAAVLAMVGLAPAEEAEQVAFKYVGVDGCDTCHKRESTGDQYGKWLAGPHAKAFETLGSEAAKKIATEKKLGDPQQAAECIACHVAGHPLTMDKIEPGRKEAHETAEEQAALIAARMAEGVTCEACHGPGSEDKSRKTMQSREASIAAGMVVPDEATCTQCHNDKSPTFKGFDFAEYSAKIAHPNPAKTE